MKPVLTKALLDFLVRHAVANTDTLTHWETWPDTVEGRADRFRLRVYLEFANNPSFDVALSVNPDGKQWYSITEQHPDSRFHDFGPVPEELIRPKAP